MVLVSFIYVHCTLNMLNAFCNLKQIVCSVERYVRNLEQTTDQFPFDLFHYILNLMYQGF